MNSTRQSSHQVAIIGAGLSGLSCAVQLDKLGIDYVVLEAGTKIGGRVATEQIDGYVIDTGFQTLLTSYPDARRLLDFRKLELQNFYAGLYYQTGIERRLISDPRKHPDALSEISSSRILDHHDLPRILQICTQLIQRTSRKNLLESATCDFIDPHFKSAAVRDILIPLLQGVFLEQKLSTKLAMTQFVLSHFLRGNAALPLRGMQTIPDQLAAALRGQVRLNTRVVSVSEGRVELADDSAVNADAIVVATDATSANHLIGWPPPQTQKSVGYFYFKADERPLDHAAVFIPGSNRGPILTVATVSDVSPAYSPDDSHLISVSCLTEPPTTRPQLPREAVHEELLTLFGSKVTDWQEITAGIVPNALPTQFGSTLLAAPDPKFGASLFICGDYTDTPSINGALHSGRRAAVAVADLIFEGRRHFDHMVGG